MVGARSKEDSALSDRAPRTRASAARTSRLALASSARSRSSVVSPSTRHASAAARAAAAGPESTGGGNADGTAFGEAAAPPVSAGSRNWAGTGTGGGRYSGAPQAVSTTASRIAGFRMRRLLTVQGSDGTPMGECAGWGPQGTSRRDVPPGWLNSFITIEHPTVSRPRTARPRACSTLVLDSLAARPSEQLSRVRLQRVPPNAIMDVLAIPPGLDQAGSHQLLHVMRNGSLGDREHRPQSGAGTLLTPGDRLQQGHAPGIGERLGDQGELRLRERRPDRRSHRHSLMFIELSNRRQGGTRGVISRRRASPARAESPSPRPARQGHRRHPPPRGAHAGPGPAGRSGRTAGRDRERSRRR